VVLIKNYLTGEVEYEIYVFGERTFVVPVKKERFTQGRRWDETYQEPEVRQNQMLDSMIERIIGRFVRMDDVQITNENGVATVSVPPQSVSIIIKRTKRKLQKLEERLGIRILIRPSA